MVIHCIAIAGQIIQVGTAEGLYRRRTRLCRTSPVRLSTMKIVDVMMDLLTFSFWWCC